MRRGCLVLTALAAALFVVLAGLTLFGSIPRIASFQWGHDMLETWVEQNTGAELRTGWIAPLIYPGIGVQIRDLDVKLKGKEQRAGDFFQADTIKVLADAGELMHNRRIVWQEIILERPRVVLVRDKGGQWNASKFVEKLPGPEGKGPQDEGLLAWLIKDSLKGFIPKPGTSVKELLAMGDVKIRGATIEASDRSPVKKIPRKDLYLADVDLTFSGEKNGGTAGFRLSFPFAQDGSGDRGPELVLSGDIQAGPDNTLHVQRITGNWSCVEVFKLAGEVRFKPELSFDARLEGEACFSAFRRGAMWPPIAYSKTIPDMRGRGRARVWLHVWGPELDRPFKMHYQGKVRIMDMTWDPGRVVAPLENVSTFMYLEDGVSRMPETTVRIAGSTVIGSGKLVEAEYPRFIIDSKSDFLDFEKFFRERRTRFEPGKPMLPMRTRWAGHAVLKQGKYGKIRIYDAEGEWDVTNKRFLTFPELRFRACNGFYTESGRSWVDFNHPTDVDFRFDGKVEDMDVTTFVDQLFDTTVFLHGDASTEGYVQGTYVDGEFVPRSLEGDMRVTVEDGYFEGFNLLGNLMGVFGLVLPKELRGQRFRKMTTNIRMEQGVAYFDDLHVESLALDADARGWIDFAGQHCDIKIILRFARPFTGFMEALPLVGVVTGPAGRAITTLYVRAQGHWDHLMYSALNPMDRSAPPPPDINKGKEAQSYPE